MELSTVTKKKRRRTRKCLDEIRKKSRHTASDCSTETSKQHIVKNNKAEGAHDDSHRLVTMNRLTLNMFPKAIRSETITRPLLEEIKYKSSYTYQNLDKNINCNISPKDPEIECFEHSAFNKSMPVFDQDESLQEHESSLINTPWGDFLNSHSSNPKDISENQVDKIARVYSSSSTSLSSQTLEEHGHKLYEELMNKISLHLKKITSTVIKEDVIQHTKVKLQKLYNRSWSEEYQACVVEHKKSKNTLQCSENSIAQNPLDYIRLKHCQQQEMYDDCRSGIVESFNSLSPTEAEPTTSVLNSQLTFGRECTHDVALYHTPEYNYYPHRLN